ncbi:hypothetical protein DFH06DRAFT_1220211 [Mycena polygramma]|nr:hypothetical protein DFH06DRAFT_1220211 [Mycena polygramma]
MHRARDRRQAFAVAVALKFHRILLVVSHSLVLAARPYLSCDHRISGAQCRRIVQVVLRLLHLKIECRPRRVIVDTVGLRSQL